MISTDTSRTGKGRAQRKNIPQRPHRVRRRAEAAHDPMLSARDEPRAERPRAEGAHKAVETGCNLTHGGPARWIVLHHIGDKRLEDLRPDEVLRARQNARVLKQGFGMHLEQTYPQEGRVHGVAEVVHIRRERVAGFQGLRKLWHRLVPTENWPCAGRARRRVILAREAEVDEVVLHGAAKWKRSGRSPRGSIMMFCLPQSLHN
ncbi:hypothetical protein C2E23DRAFT_115127 [Lenzites betulinus]|nr:hypothetical protein C2E23DRAFT_115127 [Lenzites betulinus]